MEDEYSYDEEEAFGDVVTKLSHTKTGIKSQGKLTPAKNQSIKNSKTFAYLKNSLDSGGDEILQIV